MLIEFIFQQQTFVEHLYCVTKIVPGVKWCVAMLYRIFQSVVLFGLETVFSDNMISGKKRPGLETNINFLLLLTIFWSKSFADFWYFLKNISTRSAKETKHGLDFFLGSLSRQYDPCTCIFFPSMKFCWRCITIRTQNMVSKENNLKHLDIVFVSQVKAHW